jgi:hypothetical protein
MSKKAVESEQIAVAPAGLPADVPVATQVIAAGPVALNRTL